MSNQVSVHAVELVDGTQIIVPDSLELITSYVLQEQGDWFEDEIKFLRVLVNPGDMVIDIGANYGVYALSLARKVGPTGQLWAFEPASETAELLSKSSAVNGTSWLHVVPEALSEFAGTAWLQMPGQAELNSLVNGAAEVSATSLGESVTVTTLDHCLERFGWSTVDLLKIDAEGEEERILRGGRRFFQEMSPLVMFEVKAGAEVHLDLVERFQSLGYHCFQLIPGLDVLAPFAADQVVDGYLLNLFAAKPDRMETLSAAGWLVKPVSAAERAQESIQLNSWIPSFESQPYARALWARWQVGIAQNGNSLLLKALEAWVTAQDQHMSIETRLLALEESYRALQLLCQPGCPASRWASLARVALALGHREQSNNAINSMLQAMESGVENGLDEPFLCPVKEFELIDPAGKLEAWLEAAGLAALEQYGSYSGFYTGKTAESRLERLKSLGFLTDSLQKRRKLLERRLGIQALEYNRTNESQSVAELFSFIGLKGPLCCIDVGALRLEDEADPWVNWAREGCAEVLGFEPIKEECDKLNDRAFVSGAHIRYLPIGLGDGEEHTLHITNAPMASSLFPPARSTVELFQALGDLMQVVSQERIKTHRLDEIKEADSTDFFKLDVQGAELMIMENASNALESASVIQCKVGFVELCEGQPLQADIDKFLRSKGFCFWRFSYTMGRSFQPLQAVRNPSVAISQMLWGDAIYIRDFRNLKDWTSRQLRASAFLLHALYDAFDLVHLILKELDCREEGDLAGLYLMVLGMSNESVQVAMSQDYPAK
jgi:protein O-GlcNAc transferase